jgi:hypothetical protein
MEEKIQTMNYEKEQIEKVLIEVVSFGEACDIRFDNLLVKFNEFDKKDRLNY